MKVALILLGLLLLESAGGYFYYQTSQAEIDALKQNNIVLTVAVEHSESAVRSLEKSIIETTEQITKVNDEFQESRKETRALQDKLSKHSLGMLVQQKPKLVERIINSATKKVGRCFEIISGAELTEAEKNAKTAKSFNSECPSLFVGSLQ